MFLAVFALAAAAFLFYIYAVTAGEVTRRADREISTEVRSLETVYRQGGVNALNEALIERMADGRPFLYLLMNGAGWLTCAPLGSVSVTENCFQAMSSSDDSKGDTAMEPVMRWPAPFISR